MGEIQIFKKYKFDLLGIICLLIVLIFILHNLFSNAFIGGTNDLEMHAYNMWFLKDSIINYHKIPSWTSDFYGGKPFLSAYPPLTYFLALPFSLIFGGILTPKIVFFVFSAITLIGFYFLAKYLFKNRLKAILASLIFLVFPSKLMDTSGGGLSQVTAIMFVPFLFLFYEKLVESPKLKFFALLAILQGLTLLTHHSVGGTIFAVLLLFCLYDGIIKRKKHVYKIIPFLIIGAIISFVFLIPAYNISDTLNFAVVKQSSSESFRPLSISRFFSKDGSRGEYLGIIAFISIFAFLLNLNKKKGSKIMKYWIISIFLLIFGLYLHILIPDFIKSIIERAVRIFSVLSVTLSIVIFVGIEEISKYLINIFKKYKLLHLNDESKINKNLKIIFTFILIVLIFSSYIHYKPSKGNELQIPKGVLEFYKEIAKDKEYYRIEDQSFAPFGTSPIIHKHGVLNGAPLQEASKYHFFFWSTSWSLLKSEPGIYNFAELYGTLSIKYFLFKNKVEIPYLKEIKKGQDYYIYENEKVLDYVRLVPNIVVTNIKDPDHIAVFYDTISKNLINFDKIGFAHSIKLKNDINFNRSLNGKIELLEREPGYLEVKVDKIKEKTYLIVAESYHPYWKAHQNGKELEIYDGIPSTLVIPVKENGIVEIKFEYTKLKIVLFYIALITIMFLIGLCIYDIKKKK